ncbi:MAG: alpha/beta hydrolase [Clostridia bacterium]|nr:alpha/beta hydrolase [Clostridia bacterium]
MLFESIHLRDNERDVRMDTYCALPMWSMDPSPARDALLILPGGAYAGHAAHEAEPVVRAFMPHCFNCFVLYYSVGEKAKFPRPLKDVSMAVAHIKRNAKKYNIDPERVFVLGFSAGGHLAASLGTMYDRDFAAFEGMAAGENKVRGMILGYPVATLGDCTHEFSRSMVMGKADATREEWEKYSPDKNANEGSAPAFIWHTAEDKDVSVKNSLILAGELIKRGIPTELHVYPYGHHGLSVANKEIECENPTNVDPHVAGWVKDCIEWTKII